MGRNAMSTIRHSSADFDKEKYGMNLGVWQQSLAYIAEDLKLNCSFRVYEKDGRINIEAIKE